MISTAVQRARGQWLPGTSGNPAGRPRGSPNRAHANLRQLLEEHAEDVVGAVVRAARAGDMLAAKLILDRVLPRRICRPLDVAQLPPINSAADACGALAAIVTATLKGDISSSEARELACVVDAYRRTLDTAELEARLARIEQRLDAVK